MRSELFTKSIIISIILNTVISFTNAQETKRFYPTNMSFIGITKKGDVYDTQSASSSKEFYIGYDSSKSTYGRGYLTFDLTGIPNGAKIQSVYLELRSLIKFDENFDKNAETAITQSSFYNFSNNIVWNMITGGPEIVKLKFEEGSGYAIKSDYLIKYVSDYIGKKIYLGIKLSNENKVVRLSADKSDLYLNVTYTTSTTTPSITPKATAIVIDSITNSSVKFTWGDVKADYYNYSIKKGTQSVASKEKVKTGSYTEINLVPDTKYNLSVDAAFLQSSGQYTIKTSTKEILTKPNIPSSPKNVKVEITSDSWEKNTRGCIVSFDLIGGSNWDTNYTIYELNSSIDSTYKQKYVNTQYGKNKNIHLIKGLEYGKTYYFGVTASNTAGESSWEVVSIKTPITPTLTVPVAPTNFVCRLMGSSESSARVLTWSYPESERSKITGFLIEERTPVYEAYNVSANTSSLYLGYLTRPGNPYIYTIVALNGPLRSNQISTGFQITGTTTRAVSLDVVNNINEEEKVIVIGNKLLVTETKDYSVKIFDMSGRLVMNNMFPTSKEIDISNLNKGVYIIHIITSEETVVRKISKN